MHIQKLSFALFSFLILTSNNYCRPLEFKWIKTFNGCGYSIKQTIDECFIVVGQMDDDLCLIKIDSVGQTLWTKKYGGSEYEVGTDVIETSDGGFLATGTTWSYGLGNGDMYLLRLNSQGDTLWSKTFGDTAHDGANSIIQTSDGNFILAGISFAQSEEYPELPASESTYMVKIDSVGEIIWEKKLSLPYEPSYITKICETFDNKIIVAGKYSNNLLSMLTNSQGSPIWLEIGSPNSSIAEDVYYDVLQTPDSSFIFAGIKKHNIEGGYENSFISKKTFEGNHIWENDFLQFTDYNDNYNIRSLLLAKNNDVIIGGAFNGYISILRFNPFGEMIFSNTSTQRGIAYDMCQTNDSGFILTGITEDIDAKLLIMKITEKSTNISDIKLIQQKYNFNIYLKQNRYVFSFSLPFFANVKITSYNAKGQLISSIMHCDHSKGTYLYKWQHQSGSLPNGILFFKLNINSHEIFKRAAIVDQ